MVATLSSSSINNNNSNNGSTAAVVNNSSNSGLVGGGGGEPVPPPNPLLRGYDDFVQNTPYITRSILIIQVVSYLISWIFDPYYSLATIPKFIYEDYEIYRLVTSTFLVNTSFISTAFACWCFMPTGTRFERAMGSVAFGWFCLVIAVVTCTIFFIICLLLYLMMDGNPAVLLHSSAGNWNLLYGVIATECVQAPVDLKRRFFAWEVPVLYYPVALLVIFSLFSGNFMLSHIISCGIGYAFGYGKLDVFKLSLSHIRKLEDSYLATLSRKEGWVTATAALGSASLFYYETAFSSNTSTSNSDGREQSFSGLPFFQSSSSSSSGFGNNSNDSSNRLLASGHALGGVGSSTANNIIGTSQRRSIADARIARLKAFDTTTTAKSSRDTTTNHTSGTQQL